MTSAEVETLAPTAQRVLLHLCRSIVEKPDEVTIEVYSKGDDGDQELVRLDVTVADGDMGRVIGRKGKVATAIRTVVAAAASKDGVSTEVEFVE